MITINSNLYITGEYNIWKTDKYLNVLIAHNESGAGYRGIYFNCSENLIYETSKSYTYFQVFNTNLTLNYTASVSPNYPYSFYEYNNELYVGTAYGVLVLVIVNKVIIRSFNGCSASPLNSIVSDTFGVLMISCPANDLINLYYSNGTYTVNSLTTSSNPM
jgi:hypothetical protein